MESKPEEASGKPVAGLGRGALHINLLNLDVGQVAMYLYTRKK